MNTSSFPFRRFLSLVALGGASVLAAACGGGGVAPSGGSVTVDIPALPPVPDPVIPPAPPPPPAPDPNAGFDLARVRAMARVGRAFYAGDETGTIWNMDDDGHPHGVLADLPFGVIEAMTYVAPRNALYVVFDGRRLGRLSLDTHAFVQLRTADPMDDDSIARFDSVTGLAWAAPLPPTFDPAAPPDEKDADADPTADGETADAEPVDEGVLYGLDRSGQAIFHFLDLDHADTVLDVAALGRLDLDESLGLTDVPAYRFLEDLAFDRARRLLIAVDTGDPADVLEQVRLVEVRLGDFGIEASLPLFSGDARALAWEEEGTVLVLDRDWPILQRFDDRGAPVP